MNQWWPCVATSTAGHASTSGYVSRVILLQLVSALSAPFARLLYPTAQWFHSTPVAMPQLKRKHLPVMSWSLQDHLLHVLKFLWQHHLEGVSTFSIVILIRVTTSALVLTKKRRPLHECWILDRTTTLWMGCLGRWFMPECLATQKICMHTPILISGWEVLPLDWEGKRCRHTNLWTESLFFSFAASLFVFLSSKWARELSSLYIYVKTC